MCWPKSTLVEDSTYACLGDDMMSCLITKQRFSRRFIVRAVTKVQLYAMDSDRFVEKVYMASCDVLRKHMLRHVFWEFFHDTLWYRKEIIRDLLSRFRAGDLKGKASGYLDPAASDPKLKHLQHDNAQHAPPKAPDAAGEQRGSDMRVALRIDRSEVMKMTSHMSKPQLPPLGRIESTSAIVDDVADDLADVISRIKDVVDNDAESTDTFKLKKLRKALLASTRDATDILGKLDDALDDEASGSPRSPR